MRELRPQIQAAARQAEIDRRPSSDIVATLGETCLFRTVVPNEYGGLALGARDVVEIAFELGHADASAAWLFLVTSGTRMLSTFPAAFVDDLYGEDAWRGFVAAGASTFAARRLGCLPGGEQDSRVHRRRRGWTRRARSAKAADIDVVIAWDQLAAADGAGAELLRLVDDPTAEGSLFDTPITVIK